MSLGKHSEFTLFRHPLKNGNSVWYARFWDPVAQRYSKTVSTGVIIAGKKERRDEAIAASYAMLPKISFRSSSLDMLFVDYVENFWTPESSYIKERALVAHKPLSSYYIRGCIRLSHMLSYIGDNKSLQVKEKHTNSLGRILCPRSNCPFGCKYPEN